MLYRFKRLPARCTSTTVPFHNNLFPSFFPVGGTRTHFFSFSQKNSCRRDLFALQCILASFSWSLLSHSSIYTYGRGTTFRTRKTEGRRTISQVDRWRTVASISNGFVQASTWNYVHFLDNKSVHIQRPLLLLVSCAEPSLSASWASFSMPKESNAAAWR